MLPELCLPSPEGLLSPDGPMVSGGWPGGPPGLRATYGELSQVGIGGGGSSSPVVATAGEAEGGGRRRGGMGVCVWRGSTCSQL